MNNNRTGIIYAISAYTLWGLLPIYWKMFTDITSLEILAHRIIWSFVFVSIILLFRGEFFRLRAVIKHKSNIYLIALAGIFITLNWGLYIWGVTSGFIVEASMGYFIEPLLMVFLGLIVFKESLNIWQLAALLSAITGVVILVVRYGKFPWFALSLAITFAVYGMLKKKIKISSMVALGLETATVLPVALSFILFRQYTGAGVFGDSLLQNLLIIGIGPATALPLLFFAEGARRIKMSTLGFTQYISPTISLLLGIFVYKETFTVIHFISFSFIWTGLLIYSFSLLYKPGQIRRKVSLVDTMKK